MLGNLLGAIKNFVSLQKEMECIYCVVDLHAITVMQDPKKLKENILIRGKYGDYHNWSRVSMGNLSDVQRYVDALPKVLTNLSV